MKEKTKVYIYTRVSTAVQVDGYSLDAQKSRMKAYAEFNDFEIVGEYEDAGKSGKSIEGRLEFNRMMEDIKSGKDGVSYVLVFKLSRFGRNAADVLSTLQVMQDFDVNLICVEDGIDSSKDAGKLMISVLSAVAEIERENIRVQTMEGRIQKAREGKWNGGFAPYGYKLEKGMLYINEEEAEAIRIIFDQYVHTDIGANGLAKYLANHGINKIQRQNGKNPLFDAALIRRILKNPVYCGKIAYGRRRTEKVHGTRNDYRLVEQENYLLVDGLHEAIVSEGLWHEAQVKLLAQAKKYEKVNNGKDNKVHLLTGLLKCPICGAGMYGNKSIKHKPDGTKYKDFFYYGCKHRTMTRGHKCEYKKQINEELLDGAVAEVIIKLVSNPKFAAMMQQKINMKIDTSAIEQEIANYEKQLRQSYATKSRLIDEIDTLDPDDKHYIKRKADLDDRLYKMYDKIEDTENLLIEARAKKMAIEAEKLTADNIYKVLIYFEKLYAVMDEQEKRQIMESLISEIHIYEERQPNGQWLKSIKFKLPIIEEDMEMSLDSDTHVEAWTVIWFMSTRPFPKIPCTAPTQHQLFDILWAEISKWLRNNKALERELMWTKEKVYMKQYPEEWFAVARTASKPDALQGFHADDILYIIDEASGVDDKVFEPVLGALSTPGARLLMCGNPTQLSGFFYDSHHKNRGSYTTFHVDGRNSSRVSDDFVKTIIQMYGEDSDVFRVRVAGEFPRQENDVFIPLPLVEKSIMTEWTEPTKPAHIDIGCDVARYGDDRTVIGYKVDEKAMFYKRKSGQDLMQTADDIMELGLKLMEKYRFDKAIPIKIDDSGLGGGVTDRLRRVKREQPERFWWMDIIPVYFGQRIHHDFYYDSTTYMMSVVKNLLAPQTPEGAQKPVQLILPNDNDLVGQLSTRKYSMTDDAKIRVESKDAMKKRGMHSPDEADCILLLCLPVKPKRRGDVKK